MGSCESQVQEVEEEGPDVERFRQRYQHNFYITYKELTGQEAKEARDAFGEYRKKFVYRVGLVRKENATCNLQILSASGFGDTAVSARNDAARTALGI